MSRMGVSWDTHVPGSETGRVYGQRGYMIGMNYNGEEKNLPDLTRPALPKEVASGGHGGSHGDRPTSTSPPSWRSASRWWTSPRRSNTTRPCPRRDRPSVRPEGRRDPEGPPSSPDQTRREGGRPFPEARHPWSSCAVLFDLACTLLDTLERHRPIGRTNAARRASRPTRSTRTGSSSARAWPFCSSGAAGAGGGRPGSRRPPRRGVRPN